MKASFLIAALAVLKTCTPAPAAELTRQQVDGLSSAIYRAEGGDKARVPYGVLSVKVSGKDEARRVCERSIVNNYARWQKAGKPGEFISFMADRWCPASADPRGNVNWKNNVRKIYGKEIK